jgi:hypothetical protein
MTLSLPVPAVRAGTLYKSFGAVPMDDCTVFRVTGEAMKRLAGAT